jgi:hypothetical protein
LQRDDERRSVSGRPSLLSEAPPGENSRSGILQDLEGNRPAAGAPSIKRGWGKTTLLAAGGVVVGAALIAGMVAMVWSEGSAELAAAAVTAQPPQLASAPVEANPPAPAQPAPVATIVEETAAVSPPADDTRSLKDVLNDTPGKHDHEELSAALARPHPAPAPAKPKLAEHKKAAQPVKRPVQVAKKAEHPKAKPDSDVTLLAALMAHVQAGNPGKAPSTPAYQLKQCKLMNEAGAAQCREHLCSTTARKEAECKQAPVAVKTAAES